MSSHSGQPRSLSLHQTQPTVSAGPEARRLGSGGRVDTKTRDGAGLTSVPAAPSPVCKGSKRPQRAALSPSERDNQLIFDLS